MKNFFIFCFVCCASMMMSAQSNNWAQHLVNNIVTTISVSSEQVQQLELVANEYITAIQEINQQFTDDTERTKAKELVFNTYQASLQEILTTEQYTELLRVREERRNQSITQ